MLAELNVYLTDFMNAGIGVKVVTLCIGIFVLYGLYAYLEEERLTEPLGMLFALLVIVSVIGGILFIVGKAILLIIYTPIPW